MFNVYGLTSSSLPKYSAVKLGLHLVPPPLPVCLADRFVSSVAIAPLIGIPLGEV